MAFAKLVFPANTLALRKLQEIARFATGAITGSGGLWYADPALSEVVVTEPAGWSLQSQIIEPSGSATSGSYRLTAPCVDSSKNKCVLMGSYAERAISTASAISYTTPTSGATSAFLWVRAGSSWTGSNLNNPTTIWSSVSSAVGYPTARYDPGVGLSSDTIYVSSSARKLIIFGIESSGIVNMASILEFKETAHTTKNSNIPVLCSNSTRFDADSPNVTSATAVGPYYGGTAANVYYSHQLVNWYVPALGTTAVRNESDYGINNVEFFTSPTALNITASGAAAYPLIPLTDIRNIYGEGIHNYSDLTNFYITYRGASYSGQGDTLTVGGDTYVLLQCGPATANYRAFAVKKA